MTTGRHPVEIRPTDPLLRWMGPREPSPDLVHDGDAVAWLGRASRPGESWVSGLGDDPAVVARLVQKLADRHPIDGVTVVEGAFDLLPQRLQSPDPGFWCHWQLDPVQVRWTATAAVELDLDDERIAPLLAHSDSAHIFPGDPQLVRWAGVLDGDRLVAVAGQVTEPSGAAHIVSVCTDPEYRGRGLARQACLLIMAAAVREQAPMIVLEMYTANEAGRRTYEALGFTETGRYASGLLAHALPPR